MCRGARLSGSDPADGTPSRRVGALRADSSPIVVLGLPEAGRWVGLVFDHRYTTTYLDCVRRYAHRSDVRDALHRALEELAVQPFGNPQLQTHAVKRAQPDTFTSWVGNQGHRLIWRRVGNVIILLLFGEHATVQ